MKYCNQIVTYDYITNTDKEVKIDRSSCFSHIYCELSKVKSIKIYIVKDWYDGLSENQVIRYFSLLKKLGFIFTYENTKEKWIVDIIVSENSYLVGKILINSIRYVYEGDFYLIVKAFLKFSKDVVEISELWNIFVLCTYVCDQMHSFRPAHVLVRFVNHEEYLKYILNSDTPEGTLVNAYLKKNFGIVKLKDMYETYPANTKLEKALKDSKTKEELLNNYLKIIECEKSMS